MTQDWLTPTLIGGGGISLAGLGTFAARFAGKSFRRVVGEIVAGIFAEFKVEIDKRFDGNDEKTKEAADKAASLELELTRQFGGNGNGIRQAVNELTKDVAFLKGAASSTPPSTVVKQ